MHNAKPHRKGSKYNVMNAAVAVVNTDHYAFIQFPKESPVQPDDMVQYVDEDSRTLTGTVMADGAYLSNERIYVRVRFADGIDAVPADVLLKVFDYAALDMETRVVVQQKTGEIKERTRRAAQDIIDIGTRLLDVKDRLGHGSFGVWLSAEFNWSERTAQNFMRVAAAFKNANFADLNFGASALYLLSEPSTPAPARELAIERAASGEYISHNVAKVIVAQHKPAPAVTRPPGTEPDIAKVTEQAQRVFAPVTTPVTYTKVVDDYQPDVPEVEVDDEPEATEDAELVKFDIGDKVSTTFGRTGGTVWNTSERLGVYVKFPGDNAFWTTADKLVMVEPAPYKSGRVQVSEGEKEAARQSKLAAPYAHHLHGSFEWYTPKQYVEAARLLMAGIDLDPASCDLANQTVKARKFYTLETDGMNNPWHGSVFLNPPYGLDENGDSIVETWVNRLIDEYECGNVREAVLLVNATTERKWFKALWAYPICFTDHRICFYNGDGHQKQPTQGNAFVYFGKHPLTFAEAFRSFGTIVQRI